MAEVTEMPPVETPAAIDRPAETPKPAKTSTTKKAGRPPGGPEPRFFDKVASVPKSDWGTRAFMYVYADEPVCNPKTFGTTRYMLKSSAPILDLEGLKQDYGSFKGWMTLNLRKTGKDQTDEVDRYEFEIYDPKHPPKIPRSAWANDARNKKWFDLLPPEKPAASEGASTMIDAIKVYKEIRQDVKEEATPAAAPQTATSDILEAIRLGREIATPAESTPGTNPLTIATELAKTFMQMKTDNPMVEFLTKQMDRQHEELMAMRKELADRQKEAAAPPKSFIDQLLEFAGDETKLDRIKKVAGVLGFGTSEGGRTFRPTAWDGIKEVANTLAGREIGRGISQVLANLAARGAENGTPSPMPQVFRPIPTNGTSTSPGATTHETDEQRILRITEAITRPMIDEFFDKGEDGAIWAQRVYDLWPKDLEFLRTLGADTIVNLYRQYDAYLWNHITVTNGNREPQFRKFMSDFLAWRDDDEEAHGPAAPVDTGDGFSNEEHA
jgi:hypothetical protein